MRPDPFVCKTCGKRYLFAWGLIEHIIATRNSSPAYNEGDAGGEEGDTK